MANDAVVIGTSLRDGGAVPRHFAALGRELAGAGFGVTLLVYDPINDASYVDPRITVTRWPSRRPVHIADMIFFDRLLRRTRPCCVISNFGAMAIMMTIGGLRRVPVRIHWYHTLSSQTDADWNASRLKLRLLRWRTRVPYGFATQVVANSSASKRDVMSNFGVPAHKCQVFWNSLADPMANGALQTVTEGDHPRSRHFVCVGRFVISKGQDVLLKAAAQVVEKHPDVTVEFIGNGPERVPCEKLAGELGVSKNCVFAGSLPHDKVLSAMANAWATVVPSRAEAFGLVNIESMAVGVPVIGANTGGIAEVVREGQDGYLFPPGDHKALARRMIEVVEAENLRAEMAKNARLRFVEQFELSRAVRTQANWIVEQVKQRGSSTPGSPRPHFREG